jgi:hypothetical protein
MLFGFVFRELDLYAVVVFEFHYVDGIRVFGDDQHPGIGVLGAIAEFALNDTAPEIYGTEDSEEFVGQLVQAEAKLEGMNALYIHGTIGEVPVVVFDGKGPSKRPFDSIKERD